MKTLYLSIIAISGIIVIMGCLPHVFAPCATGINGTEVCGLPPIPVTLDIPTHVYIAGNTINVTGHVDRKLLQSGEPLSISFYDSKRNLVLGPEVLAEVNGTYSYHLKLRTNFGPTGQYSIQINHDKTTDAGSWFMFIANPYQLQINGSRYQINYKITSGYLDKISINKTGNSLTAYIVDTMNGGQIILELPRKIIDSKSYNGMDSQFLVLVGYPPNMSKANFTELQNDSNTRILQIDFPYDPATNAIGDWYVKITGTQIMESENVVKSPLKQFKSGTDASKVVCKQGLELLMKSHDNMPACIKSTSIQRLLGQGWINPYNFNGEYIGKESISLSAYQGVSNETFYNNGTVASDFTINVNINNFKPSNTSLVLQVYYDDGTLYKTVSVPSGMIQPDGFYKYHLIGISDENHPVPFKVVATYNNETTIAYAPVFAHP